MSSPGLVGDRIGSGGAIGSRSGCRDGPGEIRASDCGADQGDGAGNKIEAVRSWALGTGEWNRAGAGVNDGGEGYLSWGYARFPERNRLQIGLIGSATDIRIFPADFARVL